MQTTDDVVAKITISYHANGGLSVSGNIGDSALALAIIDHARDAVRNRAKPKSELVLPNRDVELQQHPAFPTVPQGDMRPQDRGD